MRCTDYGADDIDFVADASGVANLLNGVRTTALGTHSVLVLLLMCRV